MGMICWLMCEHHITPGKYYQMTEGEKTVLSAVYLWEMERRSK